MSSEQRLDLRFQMHSEDAGIGVFEQHSWPRRKSSEAEELTRYVIQKKMLNVGVLDLRRLQKPADLEKRISSHNSGIHANSACLEEKDQRKSGRKSSSKPIIQPPQDVCRNAGSDDGLEKLKTSIGRDGDRLKDSRKHLEKIIARSIRDLDAAASVDRQRKITGNFPTPKTHTNGDASVGRRKESLPIVLPRVDFPNEAASRSSSSSAHSDPKRQALLKLCWKNGQPLLMFSSGDDSILVAMLHQRGNPGMSICDCVYEIHTARELEAKKRNGAWLSQGAKGKKPEFCCKYIAELIVSSSERVSFDLTHRSLVRELVLLGDELALSAAPNREDAPQDSSNTELAAIVVESSSQQRGDPRIVAVLPRGVHGFSSTREHSKLIERWESGGACDCGGWDEGCALTILTNNSTEETANDEICGLHLFTEGDARKGKASFSLVTFKEDMFTVEFKASLPLLQAFAISVAVLHDRNCGDGAMGNNHYIGDDNYDDLSFESCSSGIPF